MDGNIHVEALLDVVMKPATQLHAGFEIAIILPSLTTGRSPKMAIDFTDGSMPVTGSLVGTP